MRLHRTFYPGERSVNATQVNGVEMKGDRIAAVKAEEEWAGTVLDMGE